MIYYALSYRESFRNQTSVSIADITNLCGYKCSNRHNGNFPCQVRYWLNRYIHDDLIVQIRGKPPNKADIKEHLVFELTDKFYSQKFVMLTDEEFETLIHIKCRVPKYSLLRCFLYVKSFMFKNTDTGTGMVCAFFQNIDAVVQELNINRKQIDKCLELLIEHNLIEKYEVGSYLNKITGSIQNVPNIYVLVSDKDKDKHINDAIGKLKIHYNIKEFMPPVHRGKKIKKERGENSEKT